MNFSKKDVFVGFLIIFVLVVGFLIYKKVKTPKSEVTSTPVSYEFRQDFEDGFKINLPENKNAIELKDVSGGDSRGLATENEILVDANDPDSDYFYEAWLQDTDSGNLASLGKLKVGKGGWLLEYTGNIQKGKTKVIVSLEKEFDNTLEKKILEGSF